jgi:hypothetical protein
MCNVQVEFLHKAATSPRTEYLSGDVAKRACFNVPLDNKQPLDHHHDETHDESKSFLFSTRSNMVQLFHFNYDIGELLCLAAFLFSTPAAIVAVYIYGYPREQAALLNCWTFSGGYLLLWLQPLLSPVSPAAGKGLAVRVQRAKSHCILWMTVFTQLASTYLSPPPPPPLPPHTQCTSKNVSCHS